MPCNAAISIIRCRQPGRVGHCGLLAVYSPRLPSIVYLRVLNVCDFGPGDWNSTPPKLPT